MEEDLKLVGGVKNRSMTHRDGSVPNRVDVEISSTTNAQGILHGGLNGVAGASVVEPARVDGASGVRENEADTSGGVVGVEDINLSLDLGLPVI